ncbi:MAG: hypothetical protein K2L07_01930 [Lachnospiraceae bacterium]|nr:hypothetical protein [Lachnospiraceae bacterium]
MRQTKTRVFSWILALVMVLALVSPGCKEVANAAQSYDGYVYVTVERFTLGQGFAEEPVKVGYYEKESVEDILKRNLGDKMIFTASSFGGNYLSAYIDGGEPKDWTTAKIPSKICEVLGSSLTKDSKRAKSNTLTENDYVNWSGFMFSVDNAFTNVGMSGVAYSDKKETDTYHNGSVIRVQFSLSYGDLNITPSEYATPLITFADKDALIKDVADYVGSKEDAAYKTAIQTLEDWDATAAELQNAQKVLEKSEEALKKTPKATSIKNVKSPKKKQIQVTWKKRSGVTGYQIQISTSSKFKKSATKAYTVKGAKKTSKTIKKSLKAKKKYYVRVRTYKKVKINGKNVTKYSSWSKKKSVKLR